MSDTLEDHQVLKELNLSDNEQTIYTEKLKQGNILLYTANSGFGHDNQKPDNAEAEKGITGDGLYAADKPNDGHHAEENTKDQNANQLNEKRRD